MPLILTKNQPTKLAHQDFFRIELDRIVNEGYSLVKLSAHSQALFYHIYYQ
ncbi:MAG: hypothetical protein RR138_01510 [Akkermansia sp.]